MPTNYTVTATTDTGGLEFLKITINGVKLPVSRDAAGNLSGKKQMSLPNSFQGTIEVKALLPMDWTVTLEFLTILDGTSILKKDVKGHIPDSLQDSKTGTITIPPPPPAPPAGEL